ncbi:MAG: hypothetical protein QOJ70_2367 [Acidobacteriota bacterium]|jgi:hypothetical protein|nr:hypothetical protein [Acidobacteriota bacterium]
MLLSELFIIYFAAAAPFGVSRFLSEHAKGTDAQPALFKATCAALAWPLTSLPRLLRRSTSRMNDGHTVIKNSTPDNHMVEQLTRATVNSLRMVEDLLACERAEEDTTARHALFAARECVERYSGLALACEWTDAGASPSQREMELCRIAGRAGDDLLLAGRCVHRRNVTRLVAHRERARAELVRALVAVCEAAPGPSASDVNAEPSFNSTEQTGVEDSKPLTTAMANAFSSVIVLLSLFDDQATASDVARLLEGVNARRGCSRSSAGAGAHAPAAALEGEESCTTRAAHTAFATQRLRTTISHRG